MPLYARWKAARTEWLVLSDAHPDGDVSPMPALSETTGALMREMARIEATTPLGLALQLRAAWESFGPAGRLATADHVEEVERPEHRIILAALNGAERMAGLPQSCPEATEAPFVDTQTAPIAAAAAAFIATLSDEQRETVFFDFTDAAQRGNWTNFPQEGRGADRGGVKWGDLDDAQRATLMDLLGAVLSFDGVRMVQEQMAADDVVAASGAGDGRYPVNFGSAHYFVSFVGTPSATSPWMLQYGEHHLGINVTVVGPNVTLSPTLTGGEPLKFEVDGRPVYIVEEEAVQAAALLGSLTDDQRETAIVSDERADLALGPGQDGKILQPEGLAGSGMDLQQKAQFLELIEARLGILNADDLAAIMVPIAENLDQTAFAWFGPTEPLGAAYWRVVGPTLILEFSPQANDGDPTDHAHNMYRDPTNEYGTAWTSLE